MSAKKRSKFHYLLPYTSKVAFLFTFCSFVFFSLFLVPRFPFALQEWLVFYKMASEALESHQSYQSATTTITSSNNIAPPTTTQVIMAEEQVANNANNIAASAGNNNNANNNVRGFNREEYLEMTTQFYVTNINDTRFEILKRYDKLKLIGSGAQGVVWYVCFDIFYFLRLTLFFQCCL